MSANQVPTAGDIPYVPDGGAAGVLDGVRVVELADERAEYVGLLLAGMGAEVWVVDGDHGKACVDVGSRGRVRLRVDKTSDTSVVVTLPDGANVSDRHQNSHVNRRSVAPARGLWWCM
jgi:hypothetical protein